jgi:hypothetical protein
VYLADIAFQVDESSGLTYSCLSEEAFSTRVEASSPSEVSMLAELRIFPL